MSRPNDGALQIWWVPQVPMPSFNFSVANLVEAKLLLDALAEYDKFQYENNVKPDYSNAGGLSVFSGKACDWIDWYDDNGNDIDAYTVEQLREATPRWEEADL